MEKSTDSEGGAGGGIGIALVVREKEKEEQVGKKGIEERRSVVREKGYQI